MKTFLSHVLRPIGEGLVVFSTGAAEIRSLQRAFYGVDSPLDVKAAFQKNLEKIEQAKVVIVGVPSDTGAGIRRGANLGPIGIRRALSTAWPRWPSFCEEHQVVDIGDILVVPQLLHDEMYNEAQVKAVQESLFASVDSDVRADYPVSPLSITERVLRVIREVRPDVKFLLLGGDHSIAWPAVKVFAERNLPFAIVQFDAHTDLLERRLGVKYCFATWSFHANDLLGRDERLVQLGIRSSAFQRSHWESTLGVRQFWAESMNGAPIDNLANLIEHLKNKQIRKIYLSNDIDGTDIRFASATGTPERHGLAPSVVERVIGRLADSFEIIGADLMEVAPPLATSNAREQSTLLLSANYVIAMVHALLR